MTAFWPIASVRGSAEIRLESGVKRTDLGHRRSNADDHRGRGPSTPLSFKRLIRLRISTLAARSGKSHAGSVSSACGTIKTRPSWPKGSSGGRAATVSEPKAIPAGLRVLR